MLYQQLHHQLRSSAQTKCGPLQEREAGEGDEREPAVHAPSDRGALSSAAGSPGGTPPADRTPTPEPAQQGGRAKRARRSASYAGMDRGDPDPPDEGAGDPMGECVKRARRSRSRATEDRARSDPREDGDGNPEEEGAGLPMRGTSVGAPSRGRKAAREPPAEEAALSPGDAHYVENENELFCVCQQPYNVDTAMISCDGCSEWYHLRCVGLTQARGPSFGASQALLGLLPLLRPSACCRVAIVCRADVPVGFISVCPA